jgi:hypothetical protein
MRKIRHLLLILFLGLVCADLSAQDAPPSPVASKPRSPFQLLPGYKLEIRGGFEPHVEGGRIWKPGGLTIEWSFDIYSGGASADTIKQKDILWRMELSPTSTVLVRTRQNRAVLSIGKELNCSATVHNDQELAEMLLMCLTFNNQKGYDAPPGTVVIEPQKN